MSTKKIIAIDFGAYEIKIVHYDIREREIVSTHRILRQEVTLAKAQDPKMDVEDETTQVREKANDLPKSASTAPSSEGIPSLWRTELEEFLGDTKNAKIVVNAPASIVATLNVPVPFSERSKVDSVLPHLLSDKLPLDLKKTVFDFCSFESERFPESPAEALVAFSKKADLEHFLAFLQEMGIDPAIISAPAITFANYADDLMRRRDEVVAFLDIGHATSTLAVVQNGTPILTRTIRSGGGKITELISERFGQTYAESINIKHKFAAIVAKDDATVNDQTRFVSATIVEGLSPVLRDVRRSFQGLFSLGSIEIGSLFVCGGTSRIKNIEQYFSDELGIKTRRFKSKIDDDKSGEWMMAAGLIRTGMDEKFASQNPNLRQGDFAYTGGVSALKKHLIRFGIVATVLIIALFGLFLLQKRGHEARQNAMKATLAKESQKLFGRKTMTSKKVREALAEGEEDSRAFVPKMSAYELLHEITKKISSEVELELSRVEIDVPRKVIQLVGATTDAQAVDKIVSDLREIECLKKVSPGATKLKHDKAQFTISIVSGCS